MKKPLVSVEAGPVRLTGLQPEIDRINREIAALGAVNLAALDELGVARERKQFLDSQSADLVEAMTTLEDAIRKIDGETRELLSGTFNTVNQHFGKMFPELFGGGNARLVITGDEILDSGVQVIAQPPGKKNQTIHLLSGGEKARLVMAKMLYDPPNFLVLDEPTNHLDMATKEMLVTALSQYEGSMLFVSHDRRFLAALSNRVLEVTPEGVQQYGGGYTEYVARTGQEAPGLRS
jgi:chromosome segregation protein